MRIHVQREKTSAPQTGRLRELELADQTLEGTAFSRRTPNSRRQLSGANSR
jgi:hypothetical protein